MFQVHDIERIFRDYFAKAIIPERIIELGTFDAIFTRIIYKLRSEINPDFDFHTFDIVKSFTEELPVNLIFHNLDIFSNIEFIGSLVIKKTLILCDNGDKIKEVHALYPYMKKDCVIMAHDYFHDKDDFKKNNARWPACEITDDDVKDLPLKNYLQDIMSEAAWLSLIK
jgi:hypothetical protein